jgi:diguanylate cyclase (GGDEF)-like protein/PAS domain S-box-containing protein
MRASLKLKAAAAITLLFLVMMALIASVQTHFIRADLVDEVAYQQSALVIQVAKDLDQKMETNLRALTAEAQAIPPHVLARPELYRDYLEHQTALLVLFDAVLIFSPAGDVLADVPLLAGRQGINVRDREYFQRGLATGSAVISAPYIGRAAQRPTVTMIAPFRDSEGRLAGFLGGTLDLLKPNFLGGLTTTRIGETGYFFIVTKTLPSVYVVHPDKSLILKPTGTMPANERALSGRERRFEGIDDQGVPALFTYKSLTTADWLLAANYPLAEALVPVVAAERRMWLISALLASLLAPLVWLLTWYLIAPLLRLHRDVQRLRQSAGTVSAGLQSRQDEIGDLARDFGALIAERQRGVDALQQSTRLLDNIVENIPVAIQLKDVQDDFRFVMWNKAAEAIYGWSRESVIGRNVNETWSAEQSARYREADMLAVASKGQEFPNRPAVTANRGTINVHLRKVPLLDAAGTPTHLLVIADDITERVVADARLEASERRLRTITDTMPAWIAYVDRQENYEFTNAAFQRAFSVTREQIRGRSVRDLVGDAEYKSLKPYLQQAFSGKTVTFECERQTANGVRWVEATYIPQAGESNDVIVGIHAMLRDITDQKLEEQRLLRLSQIDSLTGISNRVGFEQRLSDAMSESRVSGQALAVMYLDIDHFKAVNDEHGHATGDALLIAFAQRLKDNLRASDMVARLGGDEFVIVMERILERKNAARLATQILKSILVPFALRGQNEILSVTASIGIAFFDGESTTGNQLVAQADALLYSAKKSGRNTFRIDSWPEGTNVGEARIH